MKIRIAIIPGRDSSSTQAPNTGPSRMSCARGWLAAVTIKPAPMNIRPTGIRPLNHQVWFQAATAAQPSTLPSGASAGHSSPASTSASAAIHSGCSRSSAISVASEVLVEMRTCSRGAKRAISALTAKTAPPST